MQLNVKVGRKTKARWVSAIMELAGFLKVGYNVQVAQGQLVDLGKLEG